MSRSFSGGTMYIYGAGAAGITTTPITMSCRFYKIGAGNLSLGYVDKVSAYQYHGLFTSDTTLSAGSGATSGSVAAATQTGVTTNTWHHAAGVWASSTSRTAYVNGVAGTENTTSVAPTGFDNIHMGAAWLTTRQISWSGYLAEVAFWVAALTVAEIVSLAKGFSPRRVRPQALAFYAPLIRELIAPKSGLAMTVVSAAV